MKTGSLVLAFSLVLSACAGWGMRESLNVTIADFAPVDVGMLEQRYDIKIRLQNPNDKEIAFDGVVFDLEINEKSFATGVSDQKGVVPRFGETLIDVKAVSGLGSVLRQVSGLQKDGLSGLSYRIKGRLHSTEGLGSVHFDTSGEFAFPAGNSKTGN